MDRSLRRIVVGVGPSGEVDPHFRAAVRLAEAHGATLYAVHAYRLPDPLLYPYPEVSTLSPEALSAAHDAVQRRLEAEVAGLAGTQPVQVRAVAGPADAAIVEVAEEVSADLIIVGATQRGAVSRTLLGTTAGRVLRGAPAPVLVHRADDRGPPRRVLLTSDLSELSGRMLRHAVGMVRALGADESTETRALLVVGDGLDGPVVPEPAEVSVLEGIAERELRPFLVAAAPGVGAIEGRVRLGDPPREILEEAEEWPADLLVVGTHGRGGVSRFLIGSVAESVVRHAHCDVLVIPASALPGAVEGS